MTATEPTILATCGGLVGGEWDDSAYGPLLFEAVRLARVPAGRPPRVLHVNTAGGDQRTVEGAELAAARTAGVEASHLRFFPRRNVPSLGVGVVHRGRSATFVEAVTDHDGGGAVRIARAPGDPTGIRAEPLPVRRLPDAPRSVPSWTPSAWTPSPEPVDEEAP